MKFLQKTALTLGLLISLSGVISPVVGSAQGTTGLDATCTSDVAGNTDFCKNVVEEKDRSLVMGENSLMVRIAQIIVYMVGALSVIMIIIGGFRYIVSAGDSNGIQGAKNTILYALVGLVVAAFSQVIVSFVLSKL